LQQCSTHVAGMGPPPPLLSCMYCLQIEHLCHCTALRSAGHKVYRIAETCLISLSASQQQRCKHVCVMYCLFLIRDVCVMYCLFLITSTCAIATPCAVQVTRCTALLRPVSSASVLRSSASIWQQQTAQQKSGACAVMQVAASATAAVTHQVDAVGLLGC
jgi:hypothetical protein